MSLLLASLCTSAVALTAALVTLIAGPSHVVDALLRPDPLSSVDTILHQAVLPRIVLAWIVGAAMGLAGVVLQQILQNPLASPTTFGVSGSAGLTLALVTLAAPASAAAYRPWLATGGAAVAMLAAVGIAARHRLTAQRLTLAGLLITLTCGAGLSALYMLQGSQLGAIAIWGTGSLDQQAWRALGTLWPQVVAATLTILLLAPPLQTLQIGDAAARGLGLPVAGLRGGAAALAVWLSGAAVGAAGVIAFIDLGAAACVRLVGPMPLRRRMLWALPVGAAMLWATDTIAQLLGRWLGALVPTGAITGLIGAPFLIYLAAHSRSVPIAEDEGRAALRAHRGALKLAGLLGLLLLAGCLALTLGQGPAGWHLSWGNDFVTLLPLRGPRVAAALAAGILLALAGVTTQRLVGNPMASPELLGIGSAVGLAICLLLFFVPEASCPLQLLVGVLSASLVLLSLLALGYRSRFDPTTLVLTGIGLSALLATSISVILVLSPFESTRIVSWLCGSTYYVDTPTALAACGLAALGFVLNPLLWRWLDILPLGLPVARELGVPLTLARGLLLLFCAGTTAGGTLLIGPFAFIGLMAPHLARLMGFHRAGAIVTGAALVGALILVLADFAARNLFFPYQLPAGTMATFIGMLPMLWLLAR